MVRTYFPGDFLADLDQLQRQMQRFVEPSSSIRGFGRSAFPPLNIGATPDSVEIYAFAPGLDPAKIDLTIERGVLTLSGDRANDLPAESKTSATHVNERFSGRFRRTVSLADDLDPERVDAKYSDGVLHISIRRRETAKPRRVAIQ